MCLFFSRHCKIPTSIHFVSSFCAFLFVSLAAALPPAKLRAPLLPPPPLLLGVAFAVGLVGPTLQSQRPGPIVRTGGPIRSPHRLTTPSRRSFPQRGCVCACLHGCVWVRACVPTALLVLGLNSGRSICSEGLCESQLCIKCNGSC